MVVLLLLLLLLAPTIASTSMVRSMVVNKINNDYLNGKLVIEDWSIGWTSGIKLTGVRLYDAGGSQLAEVPEVSTELSLLNAIHGNYKLGKTVIHADSFNFIRNADGTTNFSTLAKSNPSPAPSNNQPAAANAGPAPASPKLPDASGDIELQQCRGAYTDNSLPENPKDKSGASRTVHHIAGWVDQAAGHQFAHRATPDDGGQGGRCSSDTLKIDGSILAVHGNVVDTDAARRAMRRSCWRTSTPALSPFIQAGRLILH